MRCSSAISCIQTVQKEPPTEYLFHFHSCIKVRSNIKVSVSKLAHDLKCFPLISINLVIDSCFGVAFVCMDCVLCKWLYGPSLH